ncbi:MAG: LemA family protein [Nitriliruptoraceae bacterium]
MSGSTTALIATATVVLVVVAWAYNRLIRAKVRVRQGWAQVAVQLQRRHDLVPRLVEVVRGYAAHEAGVLDDVVARRTAALSEHDASRRPAAEEAFGDALRRLIVITESYPDLRADERFAHLSDELRDTEDRLAFARDFASHRVATYRKLTETFPGNLLARAFGFPREQLFALDDPRAAAVPGIDLRGQ